MNHKEGSKLIGQELIFSDSDTFMVGRLIRVEAGEGGQKWRAIFEIVGFVVDSNDNFPVVFDRPIKNRFVGEEVNVMGSYSNFPSSNLRYFNNQADALGYQISRLKILLTACSDEFLRSKVFRTVSILEKQLTGL